MKFDSKYPWFILDSVIFLGLNAILLWAVRPSGEVFSLFTPWKVFLLGLAAYRGADILANEHITEPLRAPFVKLKDKDGKEVEEPFKSGFKGAMGTLLYCPSCMGVWVALVLVYGFLLWPGIFSIVVIVLALSGIERIVTNFVNVLKKMHTRPD